MATPDAQSTSERTEIHVIPDDESTDVKPLPTDDESTDVKLSHVSTDGESAEVKPLSIDDVSDMSNDNESTEVKPLSIDDESADVKLSHVSADGESADVKPSHVSDEESADVKVTPVSDGAECKAENFRESDVNEKSSDNAGFTSGKMLSPNVSSIATDTNNQQLSSDIIAGAAESSDVQLAAGDTKVHEESFDVQFTPGDLNIHNESFDAGATTGSQMNQETAEAQMQQSQGEKQPLVHDKSALFQLQPAIVQEQQIKIVQQQQTSVQLQPVLVQWQPVLQHQLVEQQPTLVQQQPGLAQQQVVPFQPQLSPVQPVLFQLQSLLVQQQLVEQQPILAQQQAVPLAKIPDPLAAHSEQQEPAQHQAEQQQNMQSRLTANHKAPAKPVVQALQCQVNVQQQLLLAPQVQQMEGQPEEVETGEQDTVLRDEMNFIQNVSRFYNDENLSDVIIKLGEQRFFAHKFVLAKSSEVFMKMLYEQAWSQNVKEEIELQESQECIIVFDKFLRYLYTAEVHINTTSAVGILCLSDKYCVDSLKALCVQYMTENSRSPKVPNALNWYPWAKALCLPTLLNQCMKTIAWNAQDIITSPDWLNFDTEFVSDVVHNSELVIRNEYSLLECLMKWLLHESRVEQLESHCNELLPLIRFPMMQSQQLYQLEHSELAENPACKELLQKLLSQAYRFRALCTSQPRLSSNFADDFYHPRDYVELTVDTVRMQNTLRFGIQVDVKMFRGPVPQETREGDWKITYRKTQADVWQLQVYGHDTAMVNNEAKVSMSVLIYNEQEKVIQVERGPVSTVSRGNCITMTINICEPALSRNMAVLIKSMTS